MSTPTEDKLVSLAALAEALGCKRTYAYQLQKEGRLVPAEDGSKRVWLRASMQRVHAMPLNAMHRWLSQMYPLPRLAMRALVLMIQKAQLAQLVATTSSRARPSASTLPLRGKKTNTAKRRAS